MNAKFAYGRLSELNRTNRDVRVRCSFHFSISSLTKKKLSFSHYIALVFVVTQCMSMSSEKGDIIISLIIFAIHVEDVIPSITCISIEAEQVRSAVSSCHQKDEGGGGHR